MNHGCDSARSMRRAANRVVPSLARFSRSVASVFSGFVAGDFAIASRAAAEMPSSSVSVSAKPSAVRSAQVDADAALGRFLRQQQLPGMVAVAVDAVPA